METKKRVHLISNAHLDPTWQWEWEEGAAEAVSTFRVAAEFCEQYDEYIFCHSEALLYEWVREYEPALYERIQRLVKAGRWHIMGGWYLQPDCNMPSGEGMAREILFGRRYFKKNFGVEPETAISLDAFGHSRGLVQLMAKAGYKNYLYCRGGGPLLFTWKGYDGSSVTAYHIRDGYGNNKGEAAGKIRGGINISGEEPLALCAWGMGDHGGGASRKDIEDIAVMKKEFAEQGIELFHSTPDAFFADVRARGEELPVHAGDINPWAPGCYTSQIRIKQKYRELENILFFNEKMCSAAALSGLMTYPKAELEEAELDMLNAQFHDYLPGSSVQPVEEMGVRKLDHGIEIMTRVRARAFFALAGGQKVAEPDEIPILVYNPHPYPVEQDVECEFMLWQQNWSNTLYVPKVFDEQGNRLPTQQEKENSSIPLDWRKRVAFHAVLPPASMSRFNCKFDIVPTEGYSHPVASCCSTTTHFVMDTARTHVEISRVTGLVDRYTVDGRDVIRPGAFTLDVIADNEDPWGMTVSDFRNQIGQFTLLSPEEGTHFSGLTHVIPSVRVIESGAVRTVIEAVFGYEMSRAVVRYKVSKVNPEMEVEVRLQWNEKKKMVKLCVPAAFASPKCIGQVMYGLEELPSTGRENVAQRFLLMEGAEQSFALINDGVYGSSVEHDGQDLKMTLIRSASYTAHPLGDRLILPPDRFSPYIDIGERLYHFQLGAGTPDEMREKAGRMAASFNERPMALSFFPCGAGERPKAGVILEGGEGVEMTAFKRAEEEENAYILRLFNPLDGDRTVHIRIPSADIDATLIIRAFEFQTFRVVKGEIRECSLMEKEL